MTPFEWVAVAIVATLSTARIARLFVWDAYPPSAWLRMKWDDITGKGNWNELLHCGYCFAPYAGAVVLGSGYLSDWHVAWWLINGWLGMSYIAAIVMAYDGDDD